MLGPTSDDTRQHDLVQLASLAEKRSARDYDFRRATGTLDADLAYISDALRSGG